MNKELLQKKNDYLLELALEEQLDHDEDMMKYSEDVVEKHEFSAKHEAKMKELFRQAAKTERKGTRKKQRMQIAAGFLVFICCSTVMVTQVEAFRVPVYNFFTEVKEKATRFGVVEECDVEISERYVIHVPSYIPEEYCIDSIMEEKSLFHIIYKSNDGEKQFIFRYYEKANDIVIDTEDANVESIDINGCNSFIVLEGDKCRVLMNKENSQYYLSGDITCNEALKIMKSIK